MAEQPTEDPGFPLADVIGGARPQGPRPQAMHLIAKKDGDRRAKTRQYRRFLDPSDLERAPQIDSKAPDGSMKLPVFLNPGQPPTPKTTATDKSPAGWAALSNLALLRRQQNRDADAVRTAQKVLEMAPSGSKARAQAEQMIAELSKPLPR